MEFKPGSFQEVTWDDVRLTIKKITPDMFEAIEAISPDSSYKLYVAEYAYGAPLIGEEGIFQLQINEKFAPINSPDIPKMMQKQLSYNHHGLPLGIVLDGSLQLSNKEINDLAYPETVFTKGSVFAAQAVIDLPTRYQAIYYWRMRAGARSVYMLPSISNREKYSKLRKYFNLECDLPNSQQDHWLLFQSIANSVQFNENWKCRCLLFGKKFIDKLSSHQKLYTALTQRVIEGTGHLRNKTVGRMWDDHVANIRNKLVDRYILSIGWHIIKASLGDQASFKLATDDDTYGPFVKITEAIVDIYGLKSYAPMIMVPQMYNRMKEAFSYVSIQFPTIEHSRNRANKAKYLMADFREIKYVVDSFINGLPHEVIREIPLYNFREYNYTYYSADNDSHGQFRPAETIFDEDPSLKYWQNFSNNKVDTRNAFLRACVRIS
jgi:hypothetical protein